MTIIHNNHMTNPKWTSLSFPSVSYSAVCISQQSSRSKVQSSKGMSTILNIPLLLFQLSLSLNFFTYTNSAIADKYGCFTRRLHQHKQLHIKKTFIGSERECLVWVTVFTVQNKHVSGLSTCNSLSFPYTLNSHYMTKYTKLFNSCMC